MRPPDTPQTLLRRLADPEADQAQWSRFHALYAPIVRAWLRLRGLRGDALEEGSQDVFVRLVRVLRANPHDPGRARFRTYLGRVVHSVACDRLRRIRAHGAEVAVPPEACELLLAPDLPIDERLDIQFRFAAYEAVLRELLRDPGLSPLQRTVLESCFLRRERPADLARRLRRLPNTITQIKKRLSKRLQARVDALCED